MIAAIIQARMSSSRLPGKVLQHLGGKPVLTRVIERVASAHTVDVVAVATSTDASDDPIVSLSETSNVFVHRGSLDDVLARYEATATALSCDTIVRITADCPLIDAAVIDQCVLSFQAGGYDYQSNCMPGVRTFPRGLDTEVFSRAALREAFQQAGEQYQREHVTPYIWQNNEKRFVIGPTIEADGDYRRSYRLTLDYPEDHVLLSHLFDHGVVDDRDALSAIRYLDQHPDIAAINAFRESDHLKHSTV